MKRLLILAISLVVAGIVPVVAQATPQEDLAALKAYYKKKFPDISLDTFNNGIYALDADRRAAWEEFEEFSPPYEEAVELGKELFNTPFKNGKTYASCFSNDGIGIRQNYPYFDSNSGKIVTLEGSINKCRVDNGEEKLKWKTGKLAAISAYMAYSSRGNKINVVVPDDPRALAIYEQGKRFFYAKRGQLNFSCADCHVYNSGGMVRANLLSTAIGHVTHWPAWRKKWAAKTTAKSKTGEVSPTAGLGTLHRRYGGCNKQVRAKPFKAQSDTYKALEYFHSYISNGQVINAPGLRQ